MWSPWTSFLFFYSFGLAVVLPGPGFGRGTDLTILKTSLRVFSPTSPQQWYQYLDFVVPEAAREIVISLEYPEEGEEVEGWGPVDVALFGPEDSFRGWSGGKRETIILGEEVATPGYLPGPITVGRWRLLLVRHPGLDQRGVRCDVEVTARMGPPLPPQDRHWYRGDFHIHNEHEDGAFSISTLTSRFRAAKLDFGVVSESRCCQGREHPVSFDQHEIRALAPRVPLLITFAETGHVSSHFNVLGPPPGAWIDLHFDGSLAASLQNAINEAHRVGALFSINHPFLTSRNYPDLCCLWKLGTPEGIDCIEVWNGGDNDALWGRSDEKSVAWWDSLLAKGRIITAIGGSDAHFTAGVKWIGKEDRGRPGRPTTWVLADSLQTASILEGVRRGRVFITARPEVSAVTFTLTDTESGRKAGIGETLHVSGETMEMEVEFNHPSPFKIRAIGPGKVLAEQVRIAGAGPLKMSLPAAGSYVRVEIREQETGTMLALTNPIWIHTRSSTDQGNLSRTRRNHAVR